MARVRPVPPPQPACMCACRRVRQVMGRWYGCLTGVHCGVKANGCEFLSGEDNR